VCTVDWAVLDLPKVQSVIRQAAKRAHKQYENVIDLEDLIQEATIMVATKADLQEAARMGEPGLLQHRLERDLGDWLLPRAKQARQTVSYDELVDNADESGFISPYVVIETASNDYSR
jgi:hypothetical protein